MMARLDRPGMSDAQPSCRLGHPVFCSTIKLPAFALHSSLCRRVGLLIYNLQCLRCGLAGVPAAIGPLHFATYA
jgi:hypothetical protein